MLEFDLVESRPELEFDDVGKVWIVEELSVGAIESAELLIALEGDWIDELDAVGILESDEFEDALELKEFEELSAGVLEFTAVEE